MTPGPSTPPTEEPGPASTVYRVEHENVPLAIYSPGTGCGDSIAVDFDGDPSGNGPPITRLVPDDDQDDLSADERDAIDMYYTACGWDATLSVAAGAKVGLLSKTEAGAQVTPERCAAAASGASIGGALRIDERADPEVAGFEVGASLCAVTPQGRVAKATITRITFDDDHHALVRFTLTTWVRES
ncbi:hypothetical protein DFJ64_0499 [Thermasporomyces composti]|uniref:Uncharacterized protein n=1 Tax=Thermasporomyces composti TaxID=696763 RepID=A0A3D9V047_THECX|nr:hypothetical protein DFJ64_0499 [Thermasporomyces composti]